MRSPPARARGIAGLGCLALALAVPGFAIAAATTPPAAVIETPHRDPWVPPGQLTPGVASTKATAADTAGDVRRQLASTFAEADTDGDGVLTRDEAARGFGFVARHFDAIDAAGRGSVSFDALMDFLARRGREARTERR